MHKQCYSFFIFCTDIWYRNECKMFTILHFSSYWFEFANCVVAFKMYQHFTDQYFHFYCSIHPPATASIPSIRLPSSVYHLRRQCPSQSGSKLNGLLSITDSKVLHHWLQLETFGFFNSPSSYSFCLISQITNSTKKNQIKNKKWKIKPEQCLGAIIPAINAINCKTRRLIFNQLMDEREPFPNRWHYLPNRWIYVKFSSITQVIVNCHTANGLLRTFATHFGRFRFFYYGHRNIQMAFFLSEFHIHFRN